MRHIVSLALLFTFLVAGPCFANTSTPFDKVFDQKNFTETWSYSGSKEEARRNFLMEAKAYLLVTKNGEKIDMSYELISTIMEVRCIFHSFAELSDRDVLVVIIARVSQDNSEAALSP